MVYQEEMDICVERRLAGGLKLLSGAVHAEQS
jgi:hypothetical protein